MATIVSSVSEENGTRYVRVRLEEFQRLASSCNVWQNRELAEELNRTAANHLERGRVAEYDACRKHAEQVRFAQPVTEMKGYRR